MQSQRVEGLAESAENGFFNDDYRPLILDKNGYLVNGHHRLDAAHILGLHEVKALQVDASIEQLMDHFKHKISYDKVMEGQINTNNMKLSDFLYLKFKKSLVESKLEEQMFGVNEYNILDMFIGSSNVDRIYGNVRRGSLAQQDSFEGIRMLKQVLMNKGIFDPNKGAGLAYQNAKFEQPIDDVDKSKLKNLAMMADRLADTTNAISKKAQELRVIMLQNPMPSQQVLQQIKQLQNEMVKIRGDQIKIIDSVDNTIKGIFGRG